MLLGHTQGFILLSKCTQEFNTCLLSESMTKRLSEARAEPQGECVRVSIYLTHYF